MIRFFLIILLWGQLGNVYGQEIDSSKVNNSSISEALHYLSEKFHIPIIYNPDIFTNEPTYSNLPQEETLESSLHSILDTNKYDIIFRATNVLIKKNFQKSVILSGFIKQKITGITLPHALVSSQGQDIFTESNEQGYFQLKGTLPMNIRVSYLGHRDTLIELDNAKDQGFEIFLSPNVTIEEITIEEHSVSDHLSKRYYYHGDRLHKLSSLLPSIGGNDDILHITRGVAGISTGAGGIGGYYIRGGDQSQNLFLLDEVALYNPFHSFGMTSIITSQNSQNLQIYKSGFRPHYIDKSGGIIDIKVQEGNLNNFEFVANINTQDAAINMQGPIIKGHTSFYASARSTTNQGPFNNIIGSGIFNDGISENSTDYNDFIFKVKSKISRANRLELTFYKGDDRVNGENENELSTSENQQLLKWGNELYSIKWNSHLWKGLFWTNRWSTNRYYTDYKSINEIDDGEVNIFLLDNTSYNRDFQFDSRVDWLVNSQFRIRTGINALSKEFTPDSNVITEDSDEIQELEVLDVNNLPDFGDESELESQMYTWYLESTYESAKNRVVVGYRLNRYSTEDFFQIDFSPRFLWTHYLPNADQIEFSVSSTRQYEHILSTTDLSLPQDIWHPANDDIIPEKGWHYNAAYIKAYENFQLRSELYYKYIRNVSYSTIDTIPNSYANFNLFTNQGDSKAYGLELSGHYARDKFDLILSYSLSQSRLQFEQLNMRRSFSSQFHKASELSITASWNVSQRFNIGMSAYFASGPPRLEVNSFGDNFGIIPQEPSTTGLKNSIRDGAEYRIDLALSYHFDTGPLSHNIKANLYNSLNTSSPLFYQNNRGNLEPKFALPTILSLSYHIKFESTPKSPNTYKRCF